MSLGSGTEERERQKLDGRWTCAFLYCTEHQSAMHLFGWIWPCTEEAVSAWSFCKNSQREFHFLKKNPPCFEGVSMGNHKCRKGDQTAQSTALPLETRKRIWRFPRCGTRSPHRKRSLRRSILSKYVKELHTF